MLQAEPSARRRSLEEAKNLAVAGNALLAPSDAEDRKSNALIQI